MEKAREACLFLILKYGWCEQLSNSREHRCVFFPFFSTRFAQVQSPASRPGKRLSAGRAADRRSVDIYCSIPQLIWEKDLQSIAG
jgi:hypothetical protein